MCETDGAGEYSGRLSRLTRLWIYRLFIPDIIRVPEMVPLS